MRNRKKFLTALAGVCLAFTMTVSFAGCGSTEDEMSSGSALNQGGEKDPTPTTGKLISQNNKTFSTLDEYLSAQKTQIDAAIKQVEGSGMSMEVKADGDTLVYRYIYEEQIEVTQGMLDYFDESIDGYRSQFDSVIDEMARLIDLENPAVELRYENPDGALIYSCVLTKEDAVPSYGEVTTPLDGGEEKRFATVQEYVDDQKEILDAASKQLEGSGMSMKIYGEGNTLVYHYIYDEPVEVSDEMTAYFDSTLGASKAQFDGVLDEMALLVDAEDLAVKLLYENPDGTLVYTCTFTK